MLQSCWFVTMACQGFILLVSYGFTACHGENHTDPKSGLDLDPENLGCTMSCQGDVTDPTFLRTFFLHLRPRQTFATGPRVIESVIRSVPLEHPHKTNTNIIRFFMQRHSLGILGVYYVAC